jgi:hypothetical protein
LCPVDGASAARLELKQKSAEITAGGFFDLASPFA